jgi:tetratricopeptide (TPR) repeat protein
MAGNDPKIQIDITARDKASEVIDDVADAAADVEKLDPEVTVTADTGGAVADLKAVDEAAGRLSHDDTELVIRAQIDQAKGQLKELEAALKATGEQADTTNRKLDDTTGAAGPGNLRGNAIADLTGPLGDASSAASDFAGVFDGLGDAAEAAAGKLGLSQGVADKLGTAIGGLGVAVAAGAAIWSLWTAHAEAARKKARELAEAQAAVGEAIRDGNREAALSNFHKAYDAAISAATTFGLKQRDVIGFITGENEAIPGLTEQYNKLKAARDATADPRLKGLADERVAAFEAEATALEGTRKAYADSITGADDKADAEARLARQLGFTEDAQKDTTKAVADSVSKLDAAERATNDLEAGYNRLQDRLSNTRAIEDFQTAMIDAQKAIHDKSADTVVDIRGVEDAIAAAGEAAKLTPIQIQTAIDLADQGEIDQAFLYTQRAIDAKGPLNMDVKIHPELPPRLKIVTRGGTTLLDEALVPITASAPAAGGNTNVTINMPAGSRGVDVVRQVAGQARRSGRRFGVPVVTYARR